MLVVSMGYEVILITLCLPSLLMYRFIWYILVSHFVANEPFSPSPIIAWPPQFSSCSYSKLHSYPNHVSENLVVSVEIPQSGHLRRDVYFFMNKRF